MRSQRTERTGQAVPRGRLRGAGSALQSPTAPGGRRALSEWESGCTRWASVALRWPGGVAPLERRRWTLFCARLSLAPVLSPWGSDPVPRSGAARRCSPSGTSAQNSRMLSAGHRWSRPQFPAGPLVGGRTLRGADPSHSEKWQDPKPTHKNRLHFHTLTTNTPKGKFGKQFYS